MFFEPIYKTTYDIPDYKEYYQYLFSYNKANHSSVTMKLNKLLLSENTDGISIFTTGSDGRFEKSPGSKIELQLYHNSVDNSIINSVKNKLISVFNTDGEIDIIDFNADILNYYSNDKSRPFPDRIIDLSSLYGSKAIESDIKSNFFSEWNDKNLVKSMIKKIKSRRSYHKKISSFGSNKFKTDLITHYDLDSGLSFYDRDNGILSFKAGPLRLIQYSLVKDYLSVYGDCNEFKTILDDLPNNIEKRLTYLDFMGLINPKINLSDLKDNYEYFVHQYNRTQDVATKNDGVGVVKFDKAEVKERLNSLDKMLTGNSILTSNNLVRAFKDLEELSDYTI